jgi:hypothetical protein
VKRSHLEQKSSMKKITTPIHLKYFNPPKYNGNVINFMLAGEQYKEHHNNIMAEKYDCINELNMKG